MFAIFTLYVLRKTVWLMSSDDFLAAFVSNIYWFRRYFIIGYMLQNVCRGDIFCDRDDCRGGREKEYD